MDLLAPTEEEFQTIRKLVYDAFGINLTGEKKTLVAGRLQKVLRERDFHSYKQYIDFLKADSNGQAIEELANRISTNHTFFYRENDHFQFFVKKSLPEAVARAQSRGQKDIRIWSAGCSSGEEPYTLIMLMLEYFGYDYSSWSAGVLATDISARALEFARNGVYPKERVDPLPEDLKRKYFKTLPDDTFAISDAVKREVTFRSLNLMNEKFPFRKPFDMIFCRNVMIYFDQPTRNALVQRYYDCLQPGGYLFIGHSESLRRDQCPFDYVMPALYQKKV